MEEKIYKGYNGNLIISDNGVTIHRGAKGFLLGGGMLRGDKTIPYHSIVAVQLKKAGMVAGYIQLTLAGGSESKGGLFQSTTDENSINFQAFGDNNNKFTEAKALIEERILESKDGNSQKHSNLDELEKLAKLKDSGVITEDEFQKKKKELLGL